jgi:hypothetical protein
VAEKFYGSKPRRSRTNPEIEALVVRLAGENSGWGYDRIVGALANLGHPVSDQTVGNILHRHGIAPVPERSQTTTWKDFLRRHMDVLAATDFFTVEVLTWRGLVYPNTVLSVDGDGGPVQISDRNADRDRVAPGIVILALHQDLVTARFCIHPIESIGREADTVVVRIVIEFHVRDPNSSGGIGRCGRIILLIGAAGHARPIWNAVYQRLTLQIGPAVSVENIAQPESEIAARGPHLQLAVICFIYDLHQDPFRCNRTRRRQAGGCST